MPPSKAPAKKRPKNPSNSHVDLARYAALRLLEGVVSKGQFFDVLWEECVGPGGSLAGAEVRDKAFCRRLTTTTLRHKGSIDKILGSRLKSWPKGAASSLLRLGVAELVYLGTPSHAVVSRMVTLVGQKGARGLVNAVLRRIAEGVAAGDIQPGPPEDDMPKWLLHRWEKQYGHDTAHDMAKASLTEAMVDVSVSNDPELWSTQLEGTVLPTGSVRVSKSGSVTSWPGFEDGAWWVQDAAAALPARLLGDVRGQTVADICAAPGGKTAQLAQAGAKVVAVDVSTNRMKKLSDNMARLKVTAVTPVVADACTWMPDMLVDAVLLDAPCSATGTIRRHPDLMHLKTDANILALKDIQAQLLSQMSGVLKVGGVIVYCTCSLETEEGEQQITQFLKAHPTFERLPITPNDVGGETAFLTPEGDVRTRPDLWPQHGGLDGFFMSRLRRVA